MTLKTRHASVTIHFLRVHPAQLRFRNFRNYARLPAQQARHLYGQGMLQPGQALKRFGFHFLK
jgi:hypothetical protein